MPEASAVQEDLYRSTLGVLSGMEFPVKYLVAPLAVFLLMALTILGLTACSHGGLSVFALAG